MTNPTLRPGGRDPGTSPSSPAPEPGPVVIAGLGVLGGSVARALRARPEASPIWAVEPDPVRAARALGEGIVDRVDPSGEALLLEALGPGRAGTLVACLPLEALPAFLDQAMGGGRGVGPGALLLDLVGMNGVVLGRIEKLGLGDRWVAGVPVLVTPETGLSASAPDLFQGVEVVLSALDAAPPALRGRAEAFWAGVGARPGWMDPRDADARVAWTQLLPQLVSNALAGALHAAGVPRDDLGPEAGGMVGLAATDPARWEALVEAAAPAVGTGMGSVQRALRVVGDLLARREVDRVVEFMERTRGWADPEREAQRPEGGEGE